MHQLAGLCICGPRTASSIDSTKFKNEFDIGYGKCSDVTKIMWSRLEASNDMRDGKKIDGVIWAGP